MPRALPTFRPEQRRRQYNRIIVGLPIAMLACTVLVLGADSAMELLPTLLGYALLTTTAAFVLGLLSRRAEARSMAEFQRYGFMPLVGDFRDGLADWPASGFPVLEASPWAVNTAYHNSDADIRCFHGLTGSNSYKSILAGAAIRVRGAGYPTFSLAPMNRSMFSSTKPSNVVFRIDPAFAEDFSLHTTNPRQLEAALGKRFMTQWRSMSDWRLEGSGDWVIVSDHRLVSHHEQVGEFVTLMLALATALRADIAANAAGGRMSSMVSARPV